MGGGADQLHAALVRLMIRFAPLKPGRNEWWMLMQLPASLRRALKNLHVARKHDEVGSRRREQVEYLRFLLRLCFRRNRG